MLFFTFFFWKHNYFTKFCQHLLLKCCYISKNNNFVATVCLPHNFWKKSGQMNCINAMDKSNSLSYGYIRKNSNEFEDIFTPPPRNFLDGRQPAGGGTKVYRLLLSIYVVSHVDYWGSRNILNCFFFHWKSDKTLKMVLSTPLTPLIGENIWNDTMEFCSNYRIRGITVAIVWGRGSVSGGIHIFKKMWIPPLKDPPRNCRGQGVQMYPHEYGKCHMCYPQTLVYHF